MRYFILILTILFGLNSFANTVPFKRHDSGHIKEIMKAWDDKKGEYLYESINAIIMDTKQPERTMDFQETGFELLKMMDEKRIDRILNAANSELEAEMSAAKRKQKDFYWQEWINFVSDTRCDMNSGMANGDPHMTTYDGQKYDFQNAGDYLLTSSDNNSFHVQTQLVRPNGNRKISQIGALAMNVNGDVVEFNGTEEKTEALLINGVEADLNNSTFILSNGGIVTKANKKGFKYLVKWPTGEQANVRVRKSSQILFDIQIHVPECREYQYLGILGNNDGNQENDLFVYDNGSVREPNSASNNYEDVFGANRRNPSVRTPQQDRGYFISHDFGDMFMLTAENSLFSNPMVDIPYELRYPEEIQTLAELTDEQIQEGLKKAKAAGVADEDLFEAVYDYGHLGLEPVSNDVSYTEPKRANKYSEPELDASGDALKSETKASTTKKNSTVYVGSSTYRNPYRYRNPYGYRSPYGSGYYGTPKPTRPGGSYGTTTPTRPSTGNSAGSSGRRPTTSGSSSGGRRPTTGGGGRTPSGGR